MKKYTKPKDKVGSGMLLCKETEPGDKVGSLSGTGLGTRLFRSA
jgi:hypothetical protein